MRAADRRELLLAAAATAFAENGYEATRMEDVAAAAGVVKSLLSKHWPSKEALFIECRNAARAQSQAAMLDAAAGAGSTAEHLVRVIDAFVDWHGAHPEAMALLEWVPILPETDTDEEDITQVVAILAHEIAPQLAPFRRAVNLGLATAFRGAITAMHEERIDPAAVKVLFRTFVVGALEHLARRLGGHLDGAADYLAWIERVANHDPGRHAMDVLRAAAAVPLPPLQPLEGPPPWAGPAGTDVPPP